VPLVQYNEKSAVLPKLLNYLGYMHMPDYFTSLNALCEPGTQRSFKYLRNQSSGIKCQPSTTIMPWAISKHLQACV